MNMTPKIQKAFKEFLDLTIEANCQECFALLDQLADLNKKLKAAAARCADLDEQALDIVYTAGEYADKPADSFEDDFDPTCEGRRFESIWIELNEVLKPYGKGIE